jgi:hypothetical protein
VFPDDHVCASVEERAQRGRPRRQAACSVWRGVTPDPERPDPSAVEEDVDGKVTPTADDDPLLVDPADAQRPDHPPAQSMSTLA